MPNSRRREMYRFQGHALSDALGACTGSMPSAQRYDAEWPAIICPLCLNWAPLPDMDEDHAPPRAGQSAMGPAQVVVMTCRHDNHSAGRTYESAAHELTTLLTEIPRQYCTIHQRQRLTPSGLFVVTDGMAFESTNVRAAYLVAFATLGHRWALTSRLDRLRLHLRQPDLRYAAPEYEVLCAHAVPGLLPFHVYEVVEPVAAVLVTGAHASVLLPCHTSPTDIRGRVVSELDVDRSGAVTRRRLSVSARWGRAWPWPRQFVLPGGTAEMAWDETSTGNMFHFDRCLEDSHHVIHAVPRRSLLAAFLAAAG